MNKQECKQLIEAYLGWLRKGLSVESLNNVCELTTPFLDRHNDHLQIYAEKQNGKIILTDDGYVLSDLRTSGVELNTEKRKKVLESVLNGFGVHMKENQLVVEASQRNLGQKLHSLVQAMLSINDMFVMAQHHVATFFLEDVQSYLDANDVRFIPHVKIAGRSGFDHAIDFLIPKSKTRPERFVQAINVPSKNTIGACLFVLGDIRETRGENSEAYAFLNDFDREIGSDVFEALEAYEVKPALWSQRSKYVEPLVN